MQCSAHALALQEIFATGLQTIAKNAVLCSTVRVNAGILSEYNQLMGDNQYFQSWLVEMSNTGRLKTIDTRQVTPRQIRSLPPDTFHYAEASYFSGGYLFIPDLMHGEQWIHSLMSLGTRIFSLTRGLPCPIPGDNPVEALQLDSSSAYNFDILNKYIDPEDEIVVYDKYINQPGLDLLLHLATRLRNGSFIRVYTTIETARRASRPTIAQVESSIRASNPAITCECKEVSASFRRRTHDRYIFCGHRLQIVFTAGIDSFGSLDITTGSRVNKISEILVYVVDASRPLQIEGADQSQLTVFTH
jgi:hypothetical protein